MNVNGSCMTLQSIQDSSQYNCQYIMVWVIHLTRINDILIKFFIQAWTLVQILVSWNYRSEKFVDSFPVILSLDKHFDVHAMES